MIVTSKTDFSLRRQYVIRDENIGEPEPTRRSTARAGEGRRDERGHETTDCTCPADTYHPGKCKHREAVEENREVLTGATPDVREADGNTSPTA